MLALTPLHWKCHKYLHTTVDILQKLSYKCCKKYIVTESQIMIGGHEDLYLLQNLEHLPFSSNPTLSRFLLHRFVNLYRHCTMLIVLPCGSVVQKPSSINLDVFHHI